MSRWNVLMTINNFVEVEAQTPKEAEVVAFRMYERGEVIPFDPMFMCEEEDLIKEEV